MEIFKAHVEADTTSDVDLRKNPALYSEAERQSWATEVRSGGLIKPQVLAPAGGWPQLKAAVHNGADAVYFGLADLNARARAANFSSEELPEVMTYLREHGVKGYCTLNVLVFDEELELLESTVRTIADAGVDAVIVQDVGAVKLIQRIAPNLRVHGSTQMSITSAEGVSFAAERGATRVVLGRELSVKEIAKVSKDVAGHAEIECFVHGALCVSYSGQCFSSEAWGGRSANRGQCAQACRLPYGLIVDGELRELGDFKYLLSPQDLMAVEQVPKLLAAGVHCFKIEGRLKGPEYVGVTTQLYRRAVDDAWAAFQESGPDAALPPPLALSQQQLWDIQQVFARGQDEEHAGLTPGFLEGPQHQHLVRGRAPRHRGVLVGRVLRVTHRGVEVEMRGPIQRGDGVVFDCGAPEVDEEGGTVYEVFNSKGQPLPAKQACSSGLIVSHFNSKGQLLPAKQACSSGLAELAFGRNAVHLSKVNVGDRVWRTRDPSLEARLHGKVSSERPAVDGAVTMATLSGALGMPLCLSLEDSKGHVAEVTSTVALEEAKGHPMAERSVRKALGDELGSNAALKLGALDLSQLDLEARLFFPASELKSMRREAVTALMAARRFHGVDEGVSPGIGVAAKMAQEAGGDGGRARSEESHTAATLTILCRSREQVEAASQARPGRSRPLPIGGPLSRKADKMCGGSP
ncbi:Peptidase U32, variant 2 [Cymbomonas tetramitiformis]|uniref:Peptidase U32, variant 2 n=1 Tax=Cymbomonas tetramitiformis TaxID=36881 RepID=A0AAE0BAX6_9CHLO|nr:Peptidase U32, variant 2 [Cymbomonas tetramitiformis]